MYKQIFFILLWLRPDCVLGLDATYYFQRGDMLVVNGNISEAIVCYSKAIDLKQNFVAAYLSRGKAYLLQGSLGPAMNDFSNAIAINPKLPEAYLSRGLVSQAWERFDSAVMDYDRAIRINPDFMEAYYARGETRFVQGDLVGAMADFDQVIARQNKFRTDSYLLKLKPSQVSRAYTFRGMAWQKLGNPGRAMEDFSAAIRVDQKFASAFNARGNLHRELGFIAAAMQDYGEAVNLDPNMAEAYYNLGVLYHSTGNLTAALVNLDRAVNLLASARSYDQDLRRRKLQSLSTAYITRAAVLSDKGMFEAADSDLTRALEINPQSEKAFYDRGRLRSRQKDYQGAIDDFRRCEAIGGKLRPVAQAQISVLAEQRNDPNNLSTPEK